MPDTMAPRFTLADVEVLERESCHRGFLQVDRLRLRCRLYEGGWSKPFHRELLLRQPGVGVLLYDPRHDKVLLVEQFRAGCLSDAANGPWAVELVAGVHDSGETEESVARREAQEEAGVVVNTLIKIGSYYNSPGGSNEQLSIYCAAFDATQAEGFYGLAEESEDIRTVIVPRVEAYAAIESGRINNAMSIIALQWLELNLGRVRHTLLAATV